jgi:hypothetical protein
MQCHKVLFYRNPISGVFRAVCSCGWSLTDANADWVRGRAAVHDLMEGEDERTQ